MSPTPPVPSADLHEALLAQHDAAADVIATWDHGDLAQAVRWLAEAHQAVEGLLAATPPPPEPGA